MNKSQHILTSVFMLLAACSNESIDTHLQPQEQRARLVLQTCVVTFTETDGATRAADTWQWADGDVLYMQYYNGNRRVSGHAVYTASTQTWEAYHNGTLATAGACRLYYFQGASSADLRNVDLSEANAVYADTTATYTLRQGTIAVSAALRPLTARLRMKGASGLTARVNGMARYTGYSAQGDRLTLSREPLVVTVGNSGYTDHLYVCFADTAARTLSLTESADNHLYRFTRSFEANVLAQGTSGYITIPTVDTNRGWTRTEVDGVNVSPDSLTFAWNATSAQTVSVAANGAWTATTTATWLTVTGGSGTGNGSFTIKPNSHNTSTTADRTATITLTRGDATCTVKVTQQKQDAVSVAPASLTFAWDATSTQTVTVTANGAWTATTTASWLTVTGGSGTGNGSFTIKPNSQNTSTTTDRTATITVRCGTKTATVSVIQNRDYSTRTFTVTGNGKTVTFKMKLVEHGTFQMGSSDSDAESDEQPVHKVTLTKDYYMGETEVTQELWYAVTGSGGSQWSDSYGKGDKRPAYYINYEDCLSFISQLNAKLSSQLGSGEQLRLPTEAEWEFAARGGNSSHGYKYSGSDEIGDVAWYTGNSGSTTHDVAGKQANELGLYDMSGNVYEWCLDLYTSYPSAAQTDPAVTTQGSASRRVLRGGSWVIDAGYCRCANRNGSASAGRSGDYGVRLAL